MADQDPYAATAIRSTKKTRTTAPASDPYAATAISAPEPAVAAAPAGPSAADLTTNSVDPATGKGYGLYRMGSYDFDRGNVSKPEIQVPYNRVQDAIAAGYKLHPDEAPRYQNDTVHNGPASRAAGYVKDLLSRMTEPMADTPVEGSALQKTEAALGNVEKLPFNVFNRTLRGLAGLPQGVVQTAVDTYYGNPEGLDPFNMAENSYKGFQQDADTLGPVAALGNLGGDAATMYMAGEAVKPVANTAVDSMMKVVNRARNAPEAAIRAVTNTGAGPIKALVDKTQKANDDIGKANALADQDHLVDTQDALHAQQGVDLSHKQALASKAQEIGEADQYEAAKMSAQQRAAEQKVNAANGDVWARHQAVAEKVQAANKAAENMLELRRQHEQEYQQATNEHYAKEAAADTKAKAEENQAWGAWRQKITGKTLDGGQIASPLQKLRLDSPEVDRTLNQLEPKGDEVPQESPYAQIREQTSQQHFGKDYRSLSPVKQDEVDDLLHAGGYSPELISFDPQAGQPITIDRAQRASSILQRYIRSGRFEGPLLGEMKQVSRVLRDAVTRASNDVGAGKELDQARNSTITYQNAFGREIKPLTTARTIREKQINPEAFQAREDEARLAKARNYDPTLVDSYRRVKAAKEALDKLPPEDQLRKSLRQVPAPPTVNDARPDFRLTDVPKPAPPRLTSGSPYERAVQAVKQPDRPNFPNRPVPTPRQTISGPDIEAARKAAHESRLNKIENRGQWAATWPLFQAARALWGGHIPSIPTMGLESAGMLATVKATTGLLRYPPLMKFLEQARPEDVALIPPEMRGDLPGLVTQAQRAGIKVAPALIAATAAMAAQQRHQQQVFSPAQAIQAMQPAGAVQ